MKKCLLTIGVLTLTTTVFSQQQIGNAGFESWEVIAAPDEEPVNWSSFLTASGSLSQFAQSQLTKSTDVRPGSSGTYSARIFSNSILGVIANGNLTTGRINMGSATPTNENNYNSTILADAAFSEAITDEPDSIVFWAKYTPVDPNDSASVSAILHDSYAHRDPIDAASAAHTRATAMMRYPSTNGQWQRISVPFTYSGPATSTAFILISFATNGTPGNGSDNDQVWIDDVELIYNGLNVPEQTTDFAQISVLDHQLQILSAQPLNGAVKIFLPNGQLVHEGEIGESYTFRQSGIFFVAVESNLGTLVRKVVNY